MPTVNLNKKEVLKLLERKISDEELKEKIPMLGTDLEEITKDEIKVEIFPNRPDLLSEQGLARALSSFLEIKTGLKQYTINKSDYQVIIKDSVSKVRPYTACAVIKNLKLNDEKIKQIIQIQEKLHTTYCRNRKKAAIGIYPLENIKLPITYEARKPKDILFQPLDFPGKMTGEQIVTRHKIGKEYGHLLKDKPLYPIFIDSNNEILSLPPIINSENTGRITEKTKDVFIEFSGFDFEVLSLGLNMIVTALADMGGEIYEMNLIYPDKKLKTPNLEPSKYKIDLNYINKILGLVLKENEVKILLEKMGYDYKNKQVLVPAYRADIMHQIDFVEDIAIAYGYYNFKEEIPKVATIAKENKLEIFKNKIADILIGLNLLEVHTYNIVSEDDQNKKMNCNLELVKLSNALSSEYNVLRSWITPSLIRILEENKHHEYPQNLFGFGRIFQKDNSTETKVKEYERLSIILCEKDSNFTKIKQILEELTYALDLKYTLEKIKHPSLIEGRTARIKINNKKIGYIGEVHPLVLNNFKIELPVSIIELNLSEILNNDL